MKEISLILRNDLLLTIDEFKILNHYSCAGKIWILIRKPTVEDPLLVKQRTLEYILDDESLTMFRLISCNILATWETGITNNLGPDDELCIKDSLFIRPYIPVNH